MHVTAFLAAIQMTVEVDAGCQSVEALKHCVAAAFPQLHVDGFDVMVGGCALDSDTVLGLEEGMCLDVVPNTRGLGILALREVGHELSEDGLFDAARDSDVALCKLYIDAGLLRDSDGRVTPLHCAAAGGYQEVCELLSWTEATWSNAWTRMAGPLFTTRRNTGSSRCARHCWIEATKFIRWTELAGHRSYSQCGEATKKFVSCWKNVRSVFGRCRNYLWPPLPLSSRPIPASRFHSLCVCVRLPRPIYSYSCIIHPLLCWRRRPDYATWAGEGEGENAWRRPAADYFDCCGAQQREARR